MTPGEVKAFCERMGFAVEERRQENGAFQINAVYSPKGKPVLFEFMGYSRKSKEIANNNLHRLMRRELSRLMKAWKEEENGTQNS